MDPLYKPQGVEQRWQQTWEEEGLYGADPDAPGETFVVMHPPPNISGSLTIGHCLQLSLEDTLVRWHRMRGFNTLFQPGYDHAGISTWASIGRTLAQEGRSQRDLGRDGFDAYVQEWLERYGGTIMSQFRLPRRLARLSRVRASRWTRATTARSFAGSSTSTSAASSTARTGSSTGARATERRSPTSRSSTRTKTTRCRTSSIRWPTAPATSPIATVRPATILADVAVAVHPDDERYRGFVGKEVDRPLRRATCARHRRRARGTRVRHWSAQDHAGHDPTDFEIGRDHGLPELTVIWPDGRMNEAAGELARLTQEEAGQASARLGVKERGQLEKREHYRHSVGHCARCHSRIEPLVVLQWWLAMEELAAPAIASVKEGRVRFTPERFARVYLDWMENVRDWCISRQIWWGQRIPVWYCPDGHVTVAETEPAACAECGLRRAAPGRGRSRHVVLVGALPVRNTRLARRDTGARSLVPGQRRRPTARDIIFLWIARMIFSGLELIGDEPFRDAVIHSYAREPRAAAAWGAPTGRRSTPRTPSSRTAPTRRATGCSR